MYPIVKKRVLNETVTLMEIEAPLVARKAMPGQFIIFRIDEEGERVPLTIAGYDREKGTVTIIFQKVGYTTEKLDSLNEGDSLLDFVGPLGEPTKTEGIHRCAVIGGGLGVAIAYPQAKALRRHRAAEARRNRHFYRIPVLQGRPAVPDRADYRPEGYGLFPDGYYPDAGGLR